MCCLGCRLALPPVIVLHTIGFGDAIFAQVLDWDWTSSLLIAGIEECVSRQVVFADELVSMELPFILYVVHVKG